MELRNIIAARLGRLHNRVSPWSSEQPLEIKYVGDYGELVAASYLRAQGYKLLRQNFRWGEAGEIDLVLRDGDLLIFAEVKTRRSSEHRAPIAAVDYKKRQLIRKGAGLWCTLLMRSDIPTRFDVVEVILPPHEKPQITHHRAVFTQREGEARPLYPIGN